MRLEDVWVELKP